MTLESLDLETVELVDGLAVRRTRDLTERDLGQKSLGGGSTLKRIKERHLTLAKAIATETGTLKEIALRQGYIPATVYTLVKDEVFMDLVNHYRSEMEVVLEDTLSKLSELSRDAIDELQRRLDEDPESLTNGQLIELMKATADRSGHGPSSNVTQNVNFGFAAKLNAARDRVKTIEGTAKEVKRDDN